MLGLHKTLFSAFIIIGIGLFTFSFYAGSDYVLVLRIMGGISFLLALILLPFMVRLAHKEERGKERLTNETMQPKRAIGGLVGRSVGGKIINSHFRGKITIKGNQEGVDVGGLVGQSEDTEIVNSSADAEIEYKQD